MEKDIDVDQNKEYIRGYVEFNNNNTVRSIQKLLGGDDTHVEPNCDTVRSAISSCKLTDDYREYGHAPKHLERIPVNNSYKPPAGTEPPATSLVTTQLLQQIDHQVHEKFIAMKLQLNQIFEDKFEQLFLKCFKTHFPHQFDDRFVPQFKLQLTLQLTLQLKLQLKQLVHTP